MFLFKCSTLPVLFLTAFLTVCSSTLATAATPTATTDFDQGFDFSRVKNIAIQPIDRTVLSTILVSDIQVANINQAITDELTQRGFTIVHINAKADLLLTWHLVTKERTDVISYDTSSRYNCWNCPARAGGADLGANYVAQGTFIVDMVDPVRLQSVWRSTFESRISGRLDADEAEAKRREAAKAIFSRFPPG
ncbi:MAG: DUF4136 domain-containing protein [Gammaproteobacteria bacterium]|nr:MAG: DUF4136 domain-containing protein [Gammaproteobacteria bacterium]